MHLSAAISGAMMSATLDFRGCRRPGLRLVCRPLWPRPRAHFQHPGLFRRHSAFVALPIRPAQLMLCRVLLGLGMGGEWASGAPWSPKPGRRPPWQSSCSGAKLLGGGLRTGRGGCRFCDAALRMACRLLRRHHSRPDYPLVAVGLKGAGSLASGADVTTAWAGSFAAHSAIACSFAPP